MELQQLRLTFDQYYDPDDHTAAATNEDMKLIFSKTISYIFINKSYEEVEEEGISGLPNMY